MSGRSERRPLLDRRPGRGSACGPGPLPPRPLPARAAVAPAAVAGRGQPRARDRQRDLPDDLPPGPPGRPARVAAPVPAPFQPHLAGPRRRRGRPDGTQRLDLPADAPPVRGQRPHRPRPPRLRPHHRRPATTPPGGPRPATASGSRTQPAMLITHTQVTTQLGGNPFARRPSGAAPTRAIRPRLGHTRRSADVRICRIVDVGCPYTYALPCIFVDVGSDS